MYLFLRRFKLDASIFVFVVVASHFLHCRTVAGIVSRGTVLVSSSVGKGGTIFPCAARYYGGVVRSVAAGGGGMIYRHQK